jgi:hypothetical protein
MAKTPCLIEPFRNPPTRDEIRTCLLKLLWIHEDRRRKQDSEDGSELEAPTLWILASHVSKPLLKDFHAHKTMMKGVYKLGPGFRTMIVSIDELPKTQNTMWIRILGRDNTQETALQEISNLPLDHPRRSKILRLLASWNVRIESGEIESFLGQEIIMAFSQAFLDWETATEERGKQEGISIGHRAIVLRQLSRRLGVLPEEVRSQVVQLSLEQSEALGDALLDFGVLTDLVQWLAQHT